MKHKHHKKLVAASMLITGATIGGAALSSAHLASATSDTGSQSETSSEHQKPELSAEKKAELKEKLSSMTDEEKQEWLKNHQPKGSKGTRSEKGERPGKPANLTDEEWEQKKAALKEKLAAMTEEEKKAWLESHKPTSGKRPERPTDSSSELPSEE